MPPNEIRSIESEAGVVATLALHPEFSFYSEDLNPHHFSDQQNGYLYYAMCELAKKSIEKVDAYNIQMILAARKETEPAIELLPVPTLIEFLDISPTIARHSKEEYRILVDNVRGKAFARDAVTRLDACKNMCYQEDTTDLQGKIFEQVEHLIYEYQRMEEIKLMAHQVDVLWDDGSEQNALDSSIEFPFPRLNQYCKIERSEAIVLSARQKRGKSIWMMNILVDMLRKGKKAIYIDTELPTKKFFHRLLAHIAQVEYRKIRDKTYSFDELARIDSAKGWLKGTKFVHIYVPVLDDARLISLIKRAYHSYKIDAVFLDYLKANGEHYLDAYKNSAALGKTLDLMKNYIGGEMNLFVITAVQATANGDVAFSQNIRRNCSTLLYLERKDQKQFESDGGDEYGNMRLTVQDNRNGEIMGDDEYISLTLDGNRCTFKESAQPAIREPY